MRFEAGDRNLETHAQEPRTLQLEPLLFRAGNGTRTRDPNLGKVVLYQLSYSRESHPDRRIPRLEPFPRNGGGVAPSLDSIRDADYNRGDGKLRGDGGEGDRTPDLVNAIHALSQLSYAPVHDSANG